MAQDDGAVPRSLVVNGLSLGNTALPSNDLATGAPVPQACESATPLCRGQSKTRERFRLPLFGLGTKPNCLNERSRFLKNITKALSVWGRASRRFPFRATHRPPISATGR